VSHIVSAARPSTTSAMVWPTKSVAAVSGTRRHVRTLLSRVSCLYPVPDKLGTETLVVDPVPATQHQVVFMVAPPTPATMPAKKVSVKGKAPVHRTTRPHTCKVTWVPSLSPGVAEALRLRFAGFWAQCCAVATPIQAVHPLG